MEDLLLQQSLGIIIGGSGDGKTPLLYQMAICIAAGVPFLGRATRPGRVLYMDYENGVGEVAEMVARLSRYLGLTSPPANLYCWNLNDCDPAWGDKGHGLSELVQMFHPVLTIIDPLASQFPQAEEKNQIANQAYRQLRKIMVETGTAFLNVHHLRKPSEDVGAKRLEDGDVKPWFNQARGAGSLINGCDLRLGVDVPGGRSIVTGNDDVALVVAGFGRVRGEIPMMRLARVHDEEGEPVGYRQLSGVALLANPEQQTAFNNLPPTFRFKEAKLTYGKAAQPTTDFLRKCLAAGILRKTTGGYEKIEQADLDQTGGLVRLAS